jgi:hypothetical protein
MKKKYKQVTKPKSTKEAVKILKAGGYVMFDNPQPAFAPKNKK